MQVPPRESRRLPFAIGVLVTTEVAEPGSGLSADRLAVALAAWRLLVRRVDADTPEAPVPISKHEER